MRPPRSALLNSCVRCSGSRLTRSVADARARTARPRRCPPCRRAARRCGSPSSRRSSPSSAGRAPSADRAARAPPRAGRPAIVVGRIEIEDADVGVVQVRRARRPDVRRDAVLVGHPEQRSRVGDERMVHGAVLLRHLDALAASRESPSTRPSARSPSRRCRAGYRSIVTGRPRMCGSMTGAIAS